MIFMIDSRVQIVQAKREPQYIELPKGETVVKLWNAVVLLQWLFLEITSACRTWRELQWC